MFSQFIYSHKLRNCHNFISLITTFKYFPISRTLYQKICLLRKLYVCCEINYNKLNALGNKADHIFDVFNYWNYKSFI